MATVDPHLLALDKGRRETFGFVTVQNYSAVFDFMRRLLFADSDFGAQRDPRRYTKVCCYEYAGYRPEVWTGQLAERIEVRTHGDSVAVQVVDSYGVWSIDSRLKTQPAYGEEALKQGMHVVISDHHLQARLRTPEGRLAWWHVELEEPGVA